MTSSSDGLGRTTSNSYDAAGHLLRSISPDGLQTTNTYNAAGAPTSSVLSLPGQSAEQAGTSGSTATRSASATYTNAARPALPTTKTDVAGSTTTYAYDTFGEVSSETDAASHVEKFAYNTGRGIVTSSVSPTGVAAGTAVTCTPPAAGCTTYAYDIYGHTIKTTDPLGHFTSATFDADGNQLTSTDANSHTTTTVYDASDRPTTVTQPSTAVATTAYNGDNTVHSTTDAATHVTSYTYDAQGRESTSVDPDSKTTTYGYDLDGRLTTQTQPTGDIITQAWDNASELTGITYSGTATHAVAYTYDPAGRRVTMTDGSGTNTYSHDRFGDTTTVTAGNGQVVGYGYDAAGRVTTIAYPGTSNTVTQHYNTIGQMDSITDPAGLITGFGYNADGAPTTTTYPNGVTATTGYNTADQATTSTLAKGATALGTLTYTRDNTGDLTGRTATSGAAGGNYTYGYTPNQYLSTSTTGGATTTLGYDVVGNPTSLGTGTQVFDPAGKLCWTSTTTVTTPSCTTPATGSNAYTYDSNGQRTTLTPSTGTATHYNWNAAGELTSITGATAATYVYNGDGLRTRKVVGTTTTNYVWDTTGSVPNMLTDGTLDYVYGPTGTAIEQYAPGGTSPAFYFNDAHGSTTALTGSAGTVVATYSYNPEGKTTAHAGTVTTPLQFGGEYSDAETGFTYLRARYYDPATALFISMDALVATTLNAYIFAANNFLNRMDPRGLWDTWDTVAAIGIGLGLFAFALTGVGAVVEISAGLAAVGVAAGVAGTGLDVWACSNGDSLGCGGAVFNGLATGGGVAGMAMEGAGMEGAGIGMSRATLPYAATGLGLDTIAAQKTLNEEDERRAKNDAAHQQCRLSDNG
ncbi:RHS repeat-associated core domain-containing protein [Subtercola sp. RTI3]|nr:RHS repeat-associated core domain-containing protein [Subtercola sp. RTI3]